MSIGKTSALQAVAHDVRVLRKCVSSAHNGFVIVLTYKGQYEKAPRPGARRLQRFPCALERRRLDRDALYRVAASWRANSARNACSRSLTYC